jgi:hypothetical protein
MSSAIKGHNDRNPDDKVDAMKLLGKLDNKVGDTVADTLFKNGTGKGPEFVIKAINANLSKDRQLTGPPGIGSKTYQALQDISADPKKAKSFLESLAHIRVQEEKNGKNELSRIYHYLNKKN